MSNPVQPSRDVPATHVTILLATYNGGRYLAEQLRSIAQQSHQYWSLVVADDASTDGTRSVIEHFALNHPEHEIVLTTSERVGSARDNFIRLLRNAPRSPYFALADQDDIWEADKLESLVQACKPADSHSDDKPCMAYSDLQVVDSVLRPIADSFLAEIRTDPRRVTFGSNLVENHVPGCAMVFNQALLDEFCSYSGSTSDIIMHDWWLALIARAFGRTAFVERPLVLYRQHMSNTMGSVRRRGPSFVLNKLKQMDRHETRRTVAQAQLFLSAYGPRLPMDIRSTLATYSTLSTHNKFARISLCVRAGTLKQTIGRRAYQLSRI